MAMERRKYTRFSTKKNTFAALRTGFDKVGRIIDISVNGLSFSYIVEESIPIESFHVDIFQSENGPYLSNIPCCVVYDILNTDKSYALVAKPRRCGLCFGPLIGKQQKYLIEFIENYKEATFIQI